MGRRANELRVLDPGEAEYYRDQGGWTHRMGRYVLWGSTIAIVAVLLFVALLFTFAYFFGEIGAYLFVGICLVALIVWSTAALISTGARISNNSTTNASNVFMRQDVVDAYTDVVRQQRSLPQSQPLAYAPPPVQQASVIPSYGEVELPQPKDAQLRF